MTYAHFFFHRNYESQVIDGIQNWVFSYDQSIYSHVAATTAQETSSDGEPSTPKEEVEIKSMDNIIISPVLSPGKPSTGQAAAATLAEAGHTLEGSEADLVILPLLLAFETKQSKLIETALDCLHVSCCKKIDSEKNTLSHHAY
jgi:hypothetical protein